MEDENRNILVKGANTFGIHLDKKSVEAFDLYLEEFLKWNQKINLSAIRTENGVVIKHFLDSLSVLPHLPNPSSLLDIGAGAGFPGIPLKIVEPSLKMTLIDSVRKKVDFQNHIIRMLGLKEIRAIHGRVQDTEILHSQGGQYDIVISRAFSDLQTLLLLGFPFLKKGGMLLAMKGERDGETVQSLSKSKEIPYRLIKTVPLILPFTSLKRTLFLFEKR